VELGTGSSLSSVEVDGYWSGDTYNPTSLDTTLFAPVQIGENTYQCHIFGRMRGGTRPFGHLLRAIGVECTYDLDIEAEAANGAGIKTTVGGYKQTIRGRYKSSGVQFHADLVGSLDVLQGCTFIGVPSLGAIRFFGSDVGSAVGCHFPSGRVVFVAATSGNSITGSYVQFGPTVLGTNNTFDIMTSTGPAKRGAAAVAHPTTGETLTIEGACDIAHHNTGASGIVAMNLPTSVSGMRLRLFRVASFSFRVFPVSGETIGTGGAGKYMSLDTDTASVSLECIVAGKWAIVGSSGTFSFQP
jgi:hypothetical protein